MNKLGIKNNKLSEHRDPVHHIITRIAGTQQSVWTTLLWSDIGCLPETSNVGDSEMLEAFLRKHGGKYGCPVSPLLSNVVPEFYLRKRNDNYEKEDGTNS